MTTAGIARVWASPRSQEHTRLILDVLRGEQSCFVRSDELEEAGTTPLLHQIEAENIVPEPYAAGTRGPARAAERKQEVYTRSDGYMWVDEEEDSGGESI